MSKKIGIIAEEESDIAVINEVFEKYMCSHTFHIRKFVGHGCGKLRNKCETWAKLLFDFGCEYILLFHDLDRNNEADLRSFLSEKICNKKYPNSIIIIPIKELEAWLLSDSTAIKKVFNLKKAPKKIHDCESIVSPKKHLRNIVWTQGKKRYLNTTHNRKIANNATINNFNRCKSYRPLDKFIQEKLCV